MRAFVERRVRRLAPALVGLVVASGVLVTVAGPGDAGDAVAGSLVVLAQLTGFWHVFGTMPVEAWLPTWSLTVEWVFYLLWPLVVIAMRRRALSPTAAMRVALGLAALLYLASMPLSPNAFYYLPVGNLAVMIVGAALALAHAREPVRTRGRDAGIADMAFLALVLAILLPTTGLSGAWLYRVTYVPIAVVVELQPLPLAPATALGGGLRPARALHGSPGPRRDCGAGSGRVAELRPPREARAHSSLVCRPPPPAGVFDPAGGRVGGHRGLRRRCMTIHSSA
ncbi:acyltransferase family protein [Rothia sp. ARF10]|nr:acyltransferase family protein [Rothia sp. ARF10]